MDKIKVLGVGINVGEKEEFLSKIKEFSSAGTGSHYIVTPNPEIILAAQEDEELFYVLSCADLSLPDGIGVKMAGWLSRVNLKRIIGSDITKDILAWANESGEKVGILVWNGGFSRKQEVKAALSSAYPKLQFRVEEIGRDEDISSKSEFLNFEPKIIFVGLGFPWQEKFMYHQLKNIPSTRVALGVGGTFDYLTGKKKRAPKFMRSIGLEWVWRLFIQPNRFSRIWNATIVFTRKLIKNKFINPFFYRPSVACILYKKESIDNKNFKYKILVAERNGWQNHWQLPQGGTDGENPMAAGERELREELNTDKFVPKRIFHNVYRYKFPEEKKNDQEIRKHSGYKGQKQGLFIAEFTGSDEDIKVNFWDHAAWKWVDMENLVDEVYAVRKRGAQIFLKKFKEFIKQK